MTNIDGEKQKFGSDIDPLTGDFIKKEATDKPKPATETKKEAYYRETPLIKDEDVQDLAFKIDDAIEHHGYTPEEVGQVFLRTLEEFARSRGLDISKNPPKIEASSKPLPNSEQGTKYCEIRMNGSVVYQYAEDNEGCMPAPFGQSQVHEAYRQVAINSFLKTLEGK